MTRHVFISYSHTDAAYVARLVRYLESYGLQVWTDEGIGAGSAWVREIERKISACAAFVPVMSVHSSGARWVDREIDLAEHRRKPMAPLLLNGEMFFRLRDLQFEEVFGGKLPSERYVMRLRSMVQGADGDIGYSQREAGQLRDPLTYAPAESSRNDRAFHQESHHPSDSWEDLDNRHAIRHAWVSLGFGVVSFIVPLSVIVTFALARIAVREATGGVRSTVMKIVKWARIFACTGAAGWLVLFIYSFYFDY